MTYRGRGVLYGLSSTSFTSGSVPTSCSFQSSDWGDKMDEETIPDCNGEVATHITKNPSQTLAISYVFTSGTNSGTATLSSYGAGDVVTIVDASDPSAAGAWLINSVSHKRTNTSAAIIDLNCSRFDGVTYT